MANAVNARHPDAPPEAVPGPKKVVIDMESMPKFSSKNELAEQEAELERKIVLFGEDLGSIPCFRNSFLYGISGGIGVGIFHFALSSRVPAATKFGFYSYVAITLSYWCACRYDYSKTKFEYTQLKYAMQQNAMREGTSDDMHSSASMQQQKGAKGTA